jgi:hypothetical protein
VFGVSFVQGEAGQAVGGAGGERQVPVFKGDPYCLVVLGSGAICVAVGLGETGHGDQDPGA